MEELDMLRSVISSGRSVDQKTIENLQHRLTSPLARDAATAIVAQAEGTELSVGELATDAGKVAQNVLRLAQLED